MVRLVEKPLSIDQLNISRVDIPCVLGNGVGEATRSTHPVTLYIAFNITPSDNTSSIPTKDDDSLERATLPAERVRSPPSDHLLPLSHHQPVETGNAIPQSPEELSPNRTKNTRSALDRADESMNQIVPIGRSNTWERAVGRIKWVMDTLGPIAEVRLIPL